MSACASAWHDVQVLWTASQSANSLLVWNRPTRSAAAWATASPTSAKLTWRSSAALIASSARARIVLEYCRHQRVEVVARAVRRQA